MCAAAAHAVDLTGAGSVHRVDIGALRRRRNSATARRAV
jgi:hypothetical protein